MGPYLELLGDFGEGESTRNLTLLRMAAKTAAYKRRGLVWFNDAHLIGSDCYTSGGNGGHCFPRRPNSFPRSRKGSCG